MKFPCLFLVVLFAYNAPATPKTVVAAETPGTSDSIKLGNFAFLDFDQNGDEYLFVVCKAGDSLPQLFINFEQPYQLYEYDGVSLRPAS